MTKEIPINKAIDWHDRIVISQQKQASPMQHCKAKKKRFHPAFQKVAQLPFTALYSYQKELKFVTKDKLLRNFKLVKPDRIVLDFKRDTDFRTRSFQGHGAFKKITIGNHSGYYRIVIRLDGRYIYTIHPLKEGYLLTLE